MTCSADIIHGQPLFIFFKPRQLHKYFTYTFFHSEKQQEEKQESSNDEYVYTFSRHGALTYTHARLRWDSLFLLNRKKSQQAHTF